jgi:hypothetical protein
MAMIEDLRSRTSAGSGSSGLVKSPPIVGYGSAVDKNSIAGLETIGSSLSGSLQRGRRSGQRPGGFSGGGVEHTLRAFVRPKRGSDGGPKHEELVLLPFHPAGALQLWLQYATALLRQPLRGTNTFPTRACLNPTGFAVALYAVASATYPVTLTKMRSLEEALEHSAKLGPAAWFFLQTVEQHASGK